MQCFRFWDNISDVTKWYETLDRVFSSTFNPQNGQVKISLAFVYLFIYGVLTVEIQQTFVAAKTCIYKILSVKCNFGSQIFPKCSLRQRESNRLNNQIDRHCSAAFLSMDWEC